MNEVCNEQGRVTGVLAGGRVTVTVERGEACGSCAAKGACEALGGQKKNVTLSMDNPIGARVGDRVQISISESAVLKASSVVYLVPALGLIIGAAIGWAAAGSGGAQANLSTLIGCLSGLGLGALASVVLGRVLSRRPGFAPRLSGIMGQSIPIAAEIPAEGDR